MKAEAAVITIQPQTEVESKDTKVYKSVPSGNFSSNLNVVSADITDFRSLIQFDAGALEGLGSADITGAVLRLYVTGLNTNGMSTATSATVSASPLLDNWKESPDDAGVAPLATWDALFGADPVIGVGPVTALQTVTGTGWFDWDVTVLVKSWQDGTMSNYGFLIEAPGPLGDVGIADTDNPALAPSLVVTTAVPEPSGLLSLAGLAVPLILTRRRGRSEH